MQTFIRLLFIVGFVFFGWIAKAQSTRDVSMPKPPPPQYQSVKKKDRFSFSNLFGKKEKTDVEEFRERVSENYKKNAKERRKADKVRYKDPTYFGHRKPPKKRPVGKQKFCKQCGMTH